MEKLSWEIVSDFLKSELKQTKYIMTWGTLGSLNINKDIDTLITKKPNAPSSEFFKEIHTIFERMDVFLNDTYSIRVVRFNQSVEDFYSEKLIKSKKLKFHVMIYVCLPQLITEWKTSLPIDADILSILKKDYLCLKGSANDLLSQDFALENYYSYMFTYLVMYDHINFPLPKKFMLNMSNYYLDYFFRKRMGLKAPIAKNRAEVKKCFYELCDILDKRNKEKQA